MLVAGKSLTRTEAVRQPVGNEVEKTNPRLASNGIFPFFLVVSFSFFLGGG